MAKFWAQYGGPVSQLIEVIGPVLHHADSFLPSCVSSANGIAVRVGELALDRIGVPIAHLIKQSCGQSPESVPSHFIFAKAKPSKCRIDRIV